MVLRRRTAGSAFTLVELLVVVGIISVLVAILLPTLTRAKEKARRIMCGSNLRQIYMGLVTYAGENKGWLPPHRMSITHPGGSNWVPGPTTPFSSPAEYIPPGKRVMFPVADQFATWSYVASVPDYSMDYVGGTPGDGGFFPLLFPRYVNSGGIFTCPSVQYFGFANVSSALTYTTNFDLANKALRNGGAWSFLASYIGCVYGKLTLPASQRAHTNWDGYFISGFWAGSDETRMAPRGAMMWDIGSYAFGYGPPAFPLASLGCHYVGGNFVFADGSVTWQKYLFRP